MLGSALDAGIPIALVRSHTKLDSLGVEYGRLGSIVLMLSARAGSNAHNLFDGLVSRTDESVRLAGAAAVPSHFSPFAQGERFCQASALRIARTLQNYRRLVNWLREKLPCGAFRPHQHGLYVTLMPHRQLTRPAAAYLAGDLSRILTQRGIPIRHAGSFGFDFFATEWFFDSLAQCMAVRFALADLPMEYVATAAEGIRAWHISHEHAPARKTPVAVHV